MTLIKNLVVVDVENRFNKTFPKYISIINDDKFMTVECLVENLKGIIHCRDDLVEDIMDVLLSIDDTITKHHVKRKELLKSKVLDIIGTHEQLLEDSKIIDFVESCTNSSSAKTKNMAKKIIKRSNE